MQQRAIETRKRILDAAVMIFSENGLNGATVDEIAAAAGVNKQRIYAYYGSKMGLFEAALLAVFQQVELFSIQSVKAAEADPGNMTEIMLKNFIRVHVEHPAFWRLLSWANLEGAGVASLYQARKNENRSLRIIFEAAVEQGTIRDCSFESWLYTLLAVSYFYFSNRMTLTHTLDVALTSKEWEERLCRDLNSLFGAACPRARQRRQRQHS